MHANIDAGYFSIWWAALCVFVFSITFQSWRVMNFNCLYKPERGPEFSRWLEYFFTSPLQILIVSAAFGFATLDSLLGQSGMQAVLVLLGYDIERQVKKVYITRERSCIELPKGRNSTTSCPGWESETCVLVCISASHGCYTFSSGTSLSSAGPRASAASMHS
jgi:hypothetical protein